MNADSHYASYLLRLQWAKNNTEPTWIVSMQSIKTGEQRLFPSLEALIAFLHEEFDVSGDSRGEETRAGAGDESRKQPSNDKYRVSPAKR